MKRSMAGRIGAAFQGGRLRVPRPARTRRAIQVERLEDRTLLNAAPVAVDDVFTIPSGTALNRTAPALLANDTDADGNPLHVASAASPSHGTLAWNADGSFEYEPAAGFLGVDNFTYQANDGSANSNTATVKIRVGDYAEVVLADDPLGYWRLNGARPDTPALDSSPHGLNGLYGYITSASPGAIAAETDGAGAFGIGSSYVYLAQPPSLQSLQNNFTIEAWVNPDSLSGDGFIFTNSQHQLTEGFTLRRSGNRLDFATQSIKDYFSPAVFTTANTWYHVAVTFDASNDATFYINGQFVATVAGSVTPPVSTSTVLIGYQNSQSSQWHGRLDEVAVYGRVLAADEVTQHYAMGVVNAGTRPVARDDGYDVLADETLEVTVPSLPTPRHSFNESFTGSVLNPNLEDPYGAFTLNGGALQQIAKRRYARTVQANYIAGDFVYEIDVDMTTADPGIMFPGIGDGVVNGQAYDEPINSVNFRMHTVGFGGGVGVAIGNLGNSVWIGEIDQPGVHRARITKTGNTLLLEVDAHFNGIFSADMAYAIDDLSATAPFLNDTNSNLFFGGDLPGAYDNLHIEASLAPGAVTGVLDNDLGVAPAASVVLVAGPEHGDLDLHADGTFTYTPDAGFVGADYLSYSVDDGYNVSSVATVQLRVNGAPVAVADEYTIAEDGFLESLGPLVLIAESGFNDASGLLSDPTPNSPFTLNSFAGGQGGAEPLWAQPWQAAPAHANIVSDVVYEGDGALHVTPTSGTFRRWQSGQSGKFVIDQYMRFTANSRTILYLFDGDIGCGCESGGGPQFGVFPDGKIQVLDSGIDEDTGFRWQPDAWYRFTIVVDFATHSYRFFLDSTEYVAPDPLGFRGNPQKIDTVLYLSEVSGAGTYIDAFRAYEGNEVEGVLHNDSDPNGNVIVAVLLDDVQYGTLDLGSDGLFSYAPDANYSGTDSFTYRAFDGVQYSAPTTVTLNVAPVNDLPIATADEYALAGDGSLSVNATAGLLANDDDVDSDDLTVILVDEPNHGSITLHDDGSFEYEAAPGFALVDTFTYQAGDGQGLSNLATVTLTRERPHIEVGTHVLHANSASQTIEIFVTGGVPVSGLNLYVQVGDGGPERTQLGLPAGVDGPAITALEVKQGTIFAGVEDVPIVDLLIPQVATAQLSIAQPGGAVAADGLLATITIDTTGFLGGTWDLKLAGVLPDLQGGPFDSDFAGMPIVIANGRLRIVPATIAARTLFYDGSEFDATDDDAIAMDKQPLLPGQTATFANYSSYVGGINGLMVDIVDPLGTPSLADFAFYVGNSNDTATWTPAPAPSAFEIRAGEGTDGADRLVLHWADGAITNKWLMVRVKSTANTGLAADDVFYFGNAIGESGDSSANALVNATDVIGTRDNPHGPFNPAAIDDRFDFNRDRLVNATDLVIARDHATSPLTALRLIAPNGALPNTPLLGGVARRPVKPASDGIDAVFDLAGKHEHSAVRTDAPSHSTVALPLAPRRSTRDAATFTRSAEFNVTILDKGRTPAPLRHSAGVQPSATDEFFARPGANLDEFVRFKRGGRLA